MTRFKHGDIFAIQLHNQQYLFGRVLLDVKKQCVKSKLLDPRSPLAFFGGAILVEMYREISVNRDCSGTDVLIPGIFVGPEGFKRDLWAVVDYKEVDPIQVEFPEGLVSSGRHSRFQRGEINLTLALTGKEKQQIGVAVPQKSALALADICLYYLNLKHLINHEYGDKMHLENADLRFSEHRSRIYQMLGEDENQSYYEMSTRLGYNISRFYT